MRGDGEDRPDSVMALLRDYDRLLLIVERVGPVVWVRTRPYRSGRLDLWQFPRSTVLVRFFVRAHVRHGVDALHRRLAAERALRTELHSADREEAVGRYAGAIPPTHGRALALAFAAGVLVVGRLAVQYAGEILSRVPELTRRGYAVPPTPGADAPIQVSHEAQRLMRRLGESIAEGVPSPGRVVDVLLSARAGDVAVVLAASSLAVYAVLRPWVPAFRYKRMLLNVAGDPAALRSTTARWSDRSRSGIFSTEETAFARLGTHPPREFPFDLAVSALLCVVPLGLGAYLMTRARWEPEWGGILFFDATLQLAFLLVFIAAARLAWLVRTWRRRHRAAPVVTPPYEVELAGGRRAVVRDPLAVALAVYLVPQVFLVWIALLARDALRAARSRGGARAALRDVVAPSRLAGVAIAAVAGWLLFQIPVPPLWILVPGNIDYASWPPIDMPLWLTDAVLGLTAPTVVAYGQSQVNRTLRRAGTPVPEGPTMAEPGVVTTGPPPATPAASRGQRGC